MEKQFVLPASLMFGGIILFAGYLVFFNSENPALVNNLLFALIVSGLVVASAYTCRKAGGANAANIFRVVLLLVMAGLSYWLVGDYTALIFLLGSVIALPAAVKPKVEAVK